MKKEWKKVISLILMLGLLLSLTACGGTARSSDGKTPASDTEDVQTESETAAAVAESGQDGESSGQTSADDDMNGSRILVVFFSRTGEQYTVGVIDKGNTAIVAEMIADQTGADLFEVLPADDQYPMTYEELTDVAKQEQNANARPAYAGEVPDLSQYDTVFIGAPVWWGDWPMIMYTFFEENAEALAGKNLVPFSTHEGSGLSGFDKKLSAACPDSTVLEGLATRGNDCQNRQDSVRESVNEWIGGLGY